VYSDSAVADVVCPFKPGRLRDLYKFSWDIIDQEGIRIGPVPNATLGVYWLASEDNRTLHVDISSPAITGLLRYIRCFGEVQSCSGTSCTPRLSHSPTFTVLRIGKYISVHNDSSVFTIYSY
jgi:hypothetical protein